ncbi:short chain dehydrogenase reductase family oxidoreductase [Seiridium cupressi]
MDPISTEVDLTQIRGKSAFITGGASGIGLATARAWAAAGAYVTIADIQPTEVGEKLASELNANYVCCDVTNWDSQIAAFKSAIMYSPTRSLDIVATFAGTAAMPGNEVDHVLAAGEPSLDVDPREPNIRNIQVNLIGVYYSTWLALYYFRLPSLSTSSLPSPPLEGDPAPTKPTKSLIIVASIGAYMDSPKASTYPASKFGVRGLFRSTRSRTLDIGVRCNLLAPWFVDTPLIAPVKKALAARGIDMAKVLCFTSVEACVEAASFCAVNDKFHGRALAIQPEGTFDLKDDVEDGWAGDQMRPIMKRRREAGFDA